MEIKELHRERNVLPEEGDPHLGPDTTIIDQSMNQMSTIHPAQHLQNMDDSRVHLNEGNSSFDEEVLFFSQPAGKVMFQNLTKVSKTGDHNFGRVEEEE